MPPKPTPNGCPCWLQLPAHNVQRAVNFYRDALGFEINYDSEAAKDDPTDHDIAFVKFPGSELGAGILRMRGTSENETLQGGREYGYAIIYTYTDDMESVIDKIDKAGGKVLMARTEIGGDRGWFSDYRDTEGNFMGLFSMQPAK